MLAHTRTVARFLLCPPPSLLLLMPHRSPRTRLFALLLGLGPAGCAVEPWDGLDSGGAEAMGSTPAGALKGTVTDAAGTPIAGAHLVTSPRGIERTTADDGTFTLDRLQPGDYAVVVAADGYVTDRLSVTVRDGMYTRANAQLDAATPRDGVVRATVTGPDGEPVEGALVTATDGSTTASATTDDDGAAVVSGVGSLTVAVSVSDPTGRLSSFSTSGLAVPAVGGVDVAATLAGIAATSALPTGSTACGACHPDELAAWTQTAHAQATSAVVGAVATGFDDGVTIDLGDASVTLGWDGGTPVATLVDAAGSEQTWAVAGLLGGEARGAVPWVESGDSAWPLPIAWLPEGAYATETGWVAGDLDPWFAADGTFLGATPSASATADATCFACHVTGTAPDDATGTVRLHGVADPTARWDEGDVGCEACHGFGSEHAASETVATITDPAHLDDTRANAVCGQCHAARTGDDGTPYAWSKTHGLFRPGDSLDDMSASAFTSWGDGSAAVPHAQADELPLGNHGTLGWTARCEDCHSAHGGGHAADLRASAEDNSVCLGCHTHLSFADDASAATAHTGHPIYAPDADFAEGRCTGCHMPETAAQLHWDGGTAAGDLASHTFVAVRPSVSVAAFDAVGASELAPGAFEANACQSCHGYDTVLFGGVFPGPTGDMTLRDTHAALDAATTELFP